ncbi:WhiB family transcriptional regulator [Actinomadura craniellae]|uniref:WhiB family transcriptional regulator n=1 Tax=Actinomadura craniellae TaxID=2231787 RepID=UPI0013149DDE|nr:WhiB family transcriptional regulator [Actinomadura craniellae]
MSIDVEEDVFIPLPLVLDAVVVPLRDLRDDLLEGAQCRFDPDLHTGPDEFADESPEECAAREDVAREVCAACPLRLECLEFALRVLPECGIWAGLTADQIAALADDLPEGLSLGEVA